MPDFIRSTSYDLLLIHVSLEIIFSFNNLKKLLRRGRMKEDDDALLFLIIMKFELAQNSNFPRFESREFQTLS